MKIALVETEVGTTEDMEAESAVGLLLVDMEGVVTEVNREVIDMGLQECQPRASPLQGHGSTPAARAPAIAATPLVRDPPRLQVASEFFSAGFKVSECRSNVHTCIQIQSNRFP
jgi:hypothetical protein